MRKVANLCAALGGICTLLLLTVGFATIAHAAPSLQLPWPIGSQHRINGGNQSYNCGLTHGGQGYETNAYAIDFEFTIGQSVAAAAAGNVVDGDNIPPFDDRGLFLEIDHLGGYKTRYLHLDSSNPWGPGIAIGVAVAQGQLVAYSGNTGSVDPHLHFDLKQTDAQNPPVTSAVKPENMSNVLDIRNGQTFGQYGACTGQASPYWTAVAPAWHGWDGWGAYADKSPVAISYSDDRPDHTHLAARTGSDIFVRSWTGSTWQAWSNISSGPSDPNFNGNVAVSNHYSNLYVVATASGTVYERHWTGSGWSAWYSLGGPITGSIAISYGTDGRVDVVGVASNKAWLKSKTGSRWGSTWMDLSGSSPITGSVAVANRDGLIHVVGWAGGKAWLKWKNGSAWYGWQSLVSSVDGSLAIDNAGAVRGNTSSTHYGVHVVAMAGGGAWLRCWENSDDCNVTGWMNLGGPLAGPLAVANQNAQIRIVGKDAGWTLWHKWRG